MIEKIKQFRHRLAEHKFLFFTFFILFDGLLGWGVDRLLFVNVFDWEQIFSFLEWCAIGLVEAIMDYWHLTHKKSLEKNKWC